MAARIAASLATLRDQINNAYPKRSKVSDGWIGDPAHAARKSDHNPNSAGVVQALDITHDPANGVDTWKLAEILRQNRDVRIKYVISNGRIFSSTTSPWTWRPYTGANKHAHHVHISVKDTPEMYDSKYLWKLDAVSGIPAAPVVAPPVGVTLDMRRRMAKLIIDWEARRDKAGHLTIHRPGDGSYEVGGVNSTYHPELAAKLKRFVDVGEHSSVETMVQDFILDYTKVATGWTTDAGVEFYLRDCVYNRGPKGAARILQRAVGVPDDGEVGQMTRAAMDEIAPSELLTKLRAARENYESDVLGPRPQLRAGLVNRWNNALAAARKFQAEAQPGIKTEIAVGTGGAVIVGGGVAVARDNDIGWGPIIAVGAIVVAAVLIAIFMIRRKKQRG